MSTLIVAFRRFLSPVPRCQEGGWEAYGRVEWPNLGGLALSYVKITHLLGCIFVLARTRKKPKRAAFITPTA